MPRKIRVEYPGALYHVMSRGDRREAIFKDDRDRLCFLETLGQACAKTGWRALAWCLMANHFHLVVETPNANLVSGMKWLLGVYTGSFNRRHKLSGHLFAGRYKALVVDGSGNGYLKTVCDYVHLNPARAGLLAKNGPLAKFPWSSYPAYLSKPARRPDWLSVDRLLGEHGISKDSAEGRRQFALRMEQRRAGEDEAEWVPVRRGWFLGSKKFQKRLLALMSRKRHGNDYGDEAAEVATERAEALVRSELRRLGWKEAELGRRRKGDKQKAKLAARLRKETTMTMKWIAERLKMGKPGSVSNLLRMHNE